MGKPKYNVRVPKYQQERNKKVRAVRKALGKAQQHKALVKAVSGPARSKKTQRRMEHKARMMDKDAELAAAQAGGDTAMAEAAAVVRAAGVAVGKKKQRVKLASRKGGAKAGAAAAKGAAEPEGMQE
jgi:hypothetical protein